MVKEVCETNPLRSHGVAVLSSSSQAIAILLSEMLGSAQLCMKEVHSLGDGQTAPSPLGDP